MQNSIYQQALLRRVNKLGTSGYFAQILMPGFGNGFGAQGANSRQINPEAGQNVSAKIPTGAPLIPLNIPKGMAIEENVTICIDMTAQGTPSTLAKEKVILFDEGQYYRAKNSIASTFPSGTVYINSASQNLYNSWVSGLCGSVYVFAGVKLQVSAVAGAVATPELQFQEPIISHTLNTRDTFSSTLPVELYNDPQAFDRTIYMIALTDQKARVDRQTAWELDVYHGLKLTMTFFTLTYARD